MFIEDRIGTLLAALIIAFSWSIPTTALAKDVSDQGPLWLWSDSAPYSSAAAKALGDGNTRLGLRLANKALESATSKRERLIAHHNLCVAHITKARSAAAMRHCQEARRLSDDGFVIATGLNATQVLDENLARLRMGDFGDLHR